MKSVVKTILTRRLIDNTRHPNHIVPLNGLNVVQPFEGVVPAIVGSVFLREISVVTRKNRQLPDYTSNFVQQMFF